MAINIQAHHVFLVFCLLLMAGCGPNDSSNKKDKPTAADEKMLSEIRLLTDPNRGAPEFVQRLRAVLKMSDGVLIIDDPLNLSLSVLPPESPWVVTCGVGVEIVFGNASSLNSESIRNDNNIRLAMNFIDKERCRTLAPLIGKELQAIISAR